jgi:integrase
VKFSQAIDAYIGDMLSAGRITSARSERSYRDPLNLHGEDVGNRDPRVIGRNDVKRTLARWANPNTQRTRRAYLISFYDWTMEEGIRKDNPARQTRRPRKRPTTVYRLTLEEVEALWDAPSSPLERRAIHLGLALGLRNAALRGLQGRHFRRAGFVHLTHDIAKGGRENWLPIPPALDALWSELALLPDDHYVLHGQKVLNPPLNTKWRAVPKDPMGAATLWRMVGKVALRAGIPEHVHPHIMRHAFGEHIARHAGLRVAQALMGHADVRTTQGYTGGATLDELAAAVGRVDFGTRAYPLERVAASPLVETAGIEPAYSFGHAVEPSFGGIAPEVEHLFDLWRVPMAVAFYAAAAPRSVPLQGFEIVASPVILPWQNQHEGVRANGC